MFLQKAFLLLLGEKSNHETALVEKGPGLSSRLSLSSANGGVTLQIQTWFQEPFKLIKLCGTDQIYEYKAPKAVTVLTHQMWA